MFLFAGINVIATVVIMTVAGTDQFSRQEYGRNA